MTIRLDSIIRFNKFFCVIGACSPGHSRTFKFTEDINKDRMSVRMIFCDPFSYLGTVVQPGTMTQDLPDRVIGEFVMTPIATDKESYYFNNFANDWNNKCYDKTPVNTHRVYLTAGQEYTIQYNECLMVVTGEVIIKKNANQVPAVSPKIVDVRVGGVTVQAVTDAIICESWLP